MIIPADTNDCSGLRMIIFRCLVSAFTMSVGSEALFSPQASVARRTPAALLRHTPRIRSSLAPMAELAGDRIGISVALAPEDAWAAAVDVDAFRRDMRALGKELFANQGPADVKHLRKMCLWSNLCAVIGVAVRPNLCATAEHLPLSLLLRVATFGNGCLLLVWVSSLNQTMWLPPNPVTVAALSLWSFSRWAVIAHHTCHGGYDHNDPTKYFHSSSFAVGSQWRRFRHWCVRRRGPLSRLCARAKHPPTHLAS